MLEWPATVVLIIMRKCPAILPDVMYTVMSMLLLLG